MIRAIFLDAMFTTFTPKGQRTRYDNMQQIIYDCAGILVPVPDIERQEKLQRARWEDVPFETYGTKWTLRQLGEAPAKIEYGRTQ